MSATGGARSILTATATATCLITLSCGTLDSNPFDEASPNHTPKNVLREYVGEDRPAAAGIRPGQED
jgi:hypothetical protein